MISRVCASCRVHQWKTDYSRNQWRKGPGASRCDECVCNGQWDDGTSDGSVYSSEWMSEASSDGQASTTRRCAACGQVRQCDDYSTNQWCYKSEEASRCRLCVSAERFPTARRNLTADADVYFGEGIYSSGAFRDVYRGRYTGGANHGKACVAKIFRDGQLEAQWYRWDAKVVERATRLVHDWNNSGKANLTIQVNQPDSIYTSHGRALLEPFISNYIKWNSNSGAVLGGRHSDMMQALSHFTYHRSGGQFLLCDVQGGVNGSNSIIISDPALLSQDGRFGPTDLGRFGLWRFFHHHLCNDWCDDHWMLPNIPSGYDYAAGVTTSTTMTWQGC